MENSREKLGLLLLCRTCNAFYTTMSGPDPIPDVRVGNWRVVVVLLLKRVGVGDVKLQGVAARGDGAA